MNKSFDWSLRLGLILLWATALFAMEIAFPGSAAHARAGAQAPAADGGAPFNQEEKLEELRKKIEDRKDKPAEEVFKNIQQLKGMPAGRLLRVMELGYSKSLGVNCTHCHVVDQWEKEDKPQKQIARDMADMVRAINGEQLKKIKNLKGPNPTVNCTTCHRGQIKPALNLG
ncbi:MAG TPA: c-type cytochrome [Blastocatellia bacterium]|nr:c-type cytochrome [Blastocatellia bacterium]